MTNETRTYTARTIEHYEGLPAVVEITVTHFSDGWVPEAAELGMGHTYADPDRAAADFARRHGYGAASAAPTTYSDRNRPEPGTVLLFDGDGQRYIIDGYKTLAGGVIGVLTRRWIQSRQAWAKTSQSWFNTSLLHRFERTESPEESA